MPAHANSGHCALARANRVFSTDEKRIRTKNTVLDKSKSGLGWFLSKIVDPRGRAAVRASSIAAVRCIVLHMPIGRKFMVNERDMILRILTEACMCVHRTGSGRAKKCR